MVKTALAAIIIAAAGLMQGGAAHAAPGTSQGITMTPSSTQITLEPSISATRSFKVINAGTDGFKVDVSVSPYRVEGVNYDPQFTQLPGTKTPTDWITLAADKAVINAGKTVEVNYTVSVPPGTAPGGYYAVVFAETSPLQQSGNGVVPHNRVGNVLYITVKGAVEKTGELKPADLAHFATHTTVPIGVKVSNTGGVHFISTATFEVTNIFGKKVYSASLERFVLPQTERLISSDWRPSSPIGLYHVNRSAIVADSVQTLPSRWIIVIHPWFLVASFVLLGLIVLYVLTLHRTRGKNTDDRG